VQPGPVVSTELLEDLRAGYAQFAGERDCEIVLDPQSARIEFVSDRKILLRVLRNMLKNAIEASYRGDTVTLGCREAGGRVQFRVHNPAFIARPLQLQIFQRSFSTRGAGRGLGTYSVKLLTERYLKGSVSFTSSESEGTTFLVTHPLTLQ
jgi:signal transduction histidine kinase